MWTPDNPRALLAGVLPPGHLAPSAQSGREGRSKGNRGPSHAKRICTAGDATPALFSWTGSPGTAQRRERGSRRAPKAYPLLQPARLPPPALRYLGYWPPRGRAATPLA